MCIRDSCIAALHCCAERSRHVKLKIEIYDRKNTTRIDMFIHGVLLRSAFWRRRRKMQGVDAGMQGVDDRMQPAYDGMQPACIPSVAPALGEVNVRQHAVAVQRQCDAFSRPRNFITYFLIYPVKGFVTRDYRSTTMYGVQRPISPLLVTLSVQTEVLGTN